MTAINRGAPIVRYISWMSLFEPMIDSDSPYWEKNIYVQAFQYGVVSGSFTCVKYCLVPPAVKQG